MPLTSKQKSDPNLRGLVPEFTPVRDTSVADALKATTSFTEAALKGATVGGLKKDIGKLVIESEGVDRVLASKQADIDDVSTEIQQFGEAGAPNELLATKRQLEKGLQRFRGKILTPTQYKAEVNRIVKNAFKEYPGFRNEIVQTAMDVGGFSALNFGIKNILDEAEASDKANIAAQGKLRKELVAAYVKASIPVPPNASIESLQQGYVENVVPVINAQAELAKGQHIQFKDAQQLRQWANAYSTNLDSQISGILSTFKEGDPASLTQTRAGLQALISQITDEGNKSTAEAGITKSTIDPLILKINNALERINPKTTADDIEAINEMYLGRGASAFNQATNGMFFTVAGISQHLKDNPVLLKSIVNRTKDRLGPIYEVMLQGRGLDGVSLFTQDGHSVLAQEWRNVLSASKISEPGQLLEFGKGIMSTLDPLYSNLMLGSREDQVKALGSLSQLFAEPWMAPSAETLSGPVRDLLVKSLAANVGSLDNVMTFLGNSDRFRIEGGQVLPAVNTILTEAEKRRQLLVNNQVKALANIQGVDVKDFLVEEPEVLQNDGNSSTTPKQSPVVTSDGGGLEKVLEKAQTAIDAGATVEDVEKLSRGKVSVIDGRAVPFVDQSDVPPATDIALEASTKITEETEGFFADNIQKIKSDPTKAKDFKEQWMKEVKATAKERSEKLAKDAKRQKEIANEIMDAASKRYDRLFEIFRNTEPEVDVQASVVTKDLERLAKLFPDETVENLANFIESRNA